MTHIIVHDSSSQSVNRLGLDIVDMGLGICLGGFQENPGLILWTEILMLYREECSLCKWATKDWGMKESHNVHLLKDYSPCTNCTFFEEHSKFLNNKRTHCSGFLSHHVNLVSLVSMSQYYVCLYLTAMCMFSDGGHMLNNFILLILLKKVRHLE